MEDKIITLPVNPETFEYQEYESQDIDLITLIELDTAFTSSSDYIEYHVYDINKNLIYPLSSNTPYLSYNVKQGDVLLNPSEDLTNSGFNQGSYFVNYSFYRQRCNSNSQTRFYISEISTDRTELRLDVNEDITPFTSSVNEFIEYRESQNHFVDFYLNFGNNKTVIANNIGLDDDEEESTILIKLYDPLPEEFGIKSQLWVAEELNTTQAYKVEFPEEIIEVKDYEFIKGPNYNIKVVQEVGEASETVSFSTLLSTPQTSSLQQLNSLLSDKGIKINVNYGEFGDFIKFSSALTRLENFYYKVKVIENTQTQLSQYINSISGPTTNTPSYSSSKASLETTINSTIENFDGYEYFLYFNSGSHFSWPKSGSTFPYQLYPTDSTEVINWLGSANESLSTYGGVALSASLYDENNLDKLHNTIPEYLVEDSNNQNYGLFIDMIAQHFDNIWLYTKDVTNRFNADNRLDYGISKDLVADAIREFGIKVYQNNYGTEDLFAAFLGVTPDGSSFPISNITGSSPQEGQEIVTSQISGSNEIIPLNDVNSRIYKKLYHNLPFLLKSKGTMKGVKTLLSILGVPSTILDVKEFGGRVKEDIVYDQPEEVFNYKLKMDGLLNVVETPFVLNSDWNSFNDVPASVMFRFQTQEILSAETTVQATQSLFQTDQDVLLSLEYDNSGGVSGSYSGSIPTPYYQYAKLKLQPEGEGGAGTVINLPFYNGDWWSVMVNYHPTSPDSFTVYAANKSSDYQLTQQVGYSSSGSIIAATDNWDNSTIIRFGKAYPIGEQKYLSGSLQEIRYYNKNVSEKVFHNYVLNPSSIQGSAINSSPNELTFRASLGGELFTGSTSIHPKISGSWETTSSFVGGSGYSIINENYLPNVEIVSKNQVPSGIRTGKASKIQVVPSTISTGDTLSLYRSVQQDSSLTSKDPDIKYVETTLSPQTQIDKDIISQIGYFNLGDYIGDVREMDKIGENYPDLDRLRNSYFEKYTKSYDLVDFVRLVKFFDNSLFKMIDNFTPSDVSLTSGVVVKQHLLERNRRKRIVPTTEDVTYSGSTGQIESFGGGTGGSFERFQTSGSQFELTQSWSEVVQTLDGPINKVRNDQSEFYTGEFSNQFGTDVSILNVNVRGVDCSRFTTPKYNTFFTITPVFLNTTNYSQEEFLSDNLIPVEGVVWLWSDGTGVKYIKISNTSQNGYDITSFLGELTELDLNLTLPINVNGDTVNDGVYSWIITGPLVKPKFTCFTVTNTRPDNIISANNATQQNFNFAATGDMIWHASASGDPVNPTLASEITSSYPQGYFPATTNYPTEQFFRGWNGARYYEGYEDYINTTGTLTGNFVGFNKGYTEESKANLRWEDVINTLSTLPWFMRGIAGVKTQTLFEDQDGQGVRTVELVALGIISSNFSGTPQGISSPCGYMQALGNRGGIRNKIIAVRYDGNQDAFILGTDSGNNGKLVLKKGPDFPDSTSTPPTDIALEGFNLEEWDGTRYVWHPKSLFTSGTPVTTVNYGEYPITSKSIQNGDHAYLSASPVGKKIIYCPGVELPPTSKATWYITLGTDAVFRQGDLSWGGFQYDGCSNCDNRSTTDIPRSTFWTLGAKSRTGSTTSTSYIQLEDVVMTSPVSWVRNQRGDTNWGLKTQYYYQGRAYKPIQVNTQSDLGFNIHLSDVNPTLGDYGTAQIGMGFVGAKTGETIPAGTYKFRMSWKGPSDSSYTTIEYDKVDINFQPTGEKTDMSTVTIPNPNKGKPTIKDGNVWNNTLNQKVLDNNGQSSPVDGTTLIKPISLTNVSVGHPDGQIPGENPHKSQVQGAKWKIELMEYTP